MLRVGVAITAHAGKYGGKAKTTPEMQKPMKGQRNYDLVLKELNT